MDGKFGKLTSLALATIFVASAMLVFVPTTTAQATCAPSTPVQPSLSILVETPTEPVRPITGVAPVKIKVTMSVPDAGFSLTPITLGVSANAPDSWATVVLDKSVEVISLPQPEQNRQAQTYEFPGKLFLDKNAPAFAQAKVTATADSGAGTCILPASATPGESSAVAGFYGKLQARLDKTIIKAGQNAQVTLPLVVQNFGNGEIETRYELVKADPDAKSPLDVVLPGVIIIPTAIGSTLDPVANLPIDVNTPYKNGYMNDIEPLTIKVTSRSADNPDITGSEAQVTALIRTQGVYVPGFELVTMLGAAIAALAGVVRKRD